MDTKRVTELLEAFEAAVREERPDLDAAKIMDAAVFAADAHGRTGKVRDYTGEPYIEHPVEVALMVARAGLGEVEVMAALMHDVVEDTDVTVEEVRERFGAEVAEVVDELTEKARPEDGNRATRKRMERDRLAGVSARAKSVKYADTVSNTVSIARNDPKFARVYVAEKRELLSVMLGGDATLLAMARTGVESAARMIGLD